MNCLLLLLCVLTLASFGTASNILVWFPMPSGSHAILGKGFAKHLLKDGHQVTLLTCFPMPEQNNLTQPDISFIQEIHAAADYSNMEKILNGTLKMNDPRILLKMMLNMTEASLKNEGVFEAIASQKFDLIIVEWFFNDILLGLGSLLDAPVILFSPTDLHSLLVNMIDSPRSPAITFDIMNPDTPPYSFYGRIKSLLITSFMEGFIKYFHKPTEEQVYNDLFVSIATKFGRKLPNYYEIYENLSFLFYNGYPSVGTPQSLPPNVKGISGYHIDTPTPALPEDLQKLMDSAKNGIVYFSMGSILKPEALSEITIESILKVFGGLKETVLWKFGKEIKNKPANVHIRKWMPQQSILAHPKTRVFITHGGLLSMTEAIFFGVPLLGLPIFGDQLLNMVKAESKGFGRIVQFSCVPECLEESLGEMLNNESYTKNVKVLSSLYHDRPILPGEELKYWVNHVIRTKGAAHLKSVTRTVPFYQTVYLDLIGLVIVFILLVRFMLRKLFRKTAVNVSKVKKNK